MNTEAVNALIELNRRTPHVLACNFGNTHFYLSTEGLATDIIDRAEVFPNFPAAMGKVNAEGAFNGWEGFDWYPEPR